MGLIKVTSEELEQIGQNLASGAQSIDDQLGQLRSQVAPLAGKIGHALSRFFLQTARELIFEQVLHLRPKSAQIRFQSSCCPFHLRLHELAQVLFDARVQLLLSTAATPYQTETAPPTELLLKQLCPVPSCFVVSAFDFAHQALDLAEHLFASGLQQSIKSVEHCGVH